MKTKQIVLTATVRGDEWVLPLSVPADLNAVMEGLMRKGYTETLQDAGAKSKDDAERYGYTVERNVLLYTGEYHFGGGGGGGSRLGQDDEALHRWLAKNGQKGKKSDLDERLMSAVRIAVLQRVEDDETRKLLLENREALNAAAEAAKEEALEFIRDTEEYKDFLAIVKGEKEVAKAPVKGIVLGKK